MLKKVVYILITIIIITYFFSKEDSNTYEYFKEGEVLEHVNGHKFSGSKQCITCHEDIYNKHIKTAHYLTSTLPSASTIKGIIEAENNSYNIDEHHRYLITERSNFFFQVLINDSLSKKEREDKIDIVIGSGVKGQSFFSWDQNKLYQLQTSYFIPNKQWVNSPGYEKKILAKERQISLNCLECHTTFAKINNSFENKLLKRSIILGVDCERCHGPAARHVEYQNNFPNDSTGKFIVSHDNMSRQQKIDMCALCHSGSKRKIPNKEFHFVLGDTLDNYFYNDFDDYNKIKYRSNLDVHGNQVELLESSKCFQKTETMDCNTCHNSHENQRGNLEYFNSICINCHKLDKQMNCGLSIVKIKNSKKKCIDCHMPEIESNSIKIQKGDSLIKVKVRSHLIKKYKESSKQLSAYIKQL